MSTEISALVSMNAFKGSLSNEEACKIVSSALKKKNIKFELLPIGDGGIGTLRSVKASLGGKVVKFNVAGQLGTAIVAKVLCLPNDKSPKSVYVESAEVVGLHLVGELERDCMRASSRGLGELLSQILEKWEKSLQRVYVGLGDSSVSDMGMGMLCGLGFNFLDGAGNSLWGSAEGLRNIKTFEAPKKSPIHSVEFIVLCDVMNPLLGPTGSARIFAPQKGATPGQVRLIEQGFENFASLIQRATGRSLRGEPMTGAAGGIAAAFLAFFNAHLVLGAPFLMDWIHFDRMLGDHAFVITGEGTTDSQTLSGKAPYECLVRAERQGKKVIFLSGSLGEGHEAFLDKEAVAGVYACGDQPTPREALYERTLEIFSEPALMNAVRGATPGC